MQYKRIVLNEPHASVEGLYDERLSGWQIDERFILPTGTLIICFTDSIIHRLERYDSPTRGSS